MKCILVPQKKEKMALLVGGREGERENNKMVQYFVDLFV